MFIDVGVGGYVGGSTAEDQFPVTTAIGSCEDLGKLEHEHEAAHIQLHREISTECTHTMSRDSTHGCITGDGHSRSIDTEVSGEHPHPKE